MRKNRTSILALVGLCVLLSGCRASPLYTGNSDNQQHRAIAPAAVPRDGNGEPMMDNLPPLGSAPATNDHASLSASRPQ